MKLACQEGLVSGKSLKEKLDNLKHYGYEGIELYGSGLMDNQARVDEIISTTKASSVKVSTICTGYRGTPLSSKRDERENAVGDIKKLLEVSAKVGAVGLIFVPIFGPPQMPDLSPYKNSIELEKELLLVLVSDLGKYAEKVDTVLLLEPLNRYETHLLKTLDQAVEIAKEVNSPGVKIMADFFHMSIEEGDIAKSIEKADEWIYHVHLADSTRLLPGYGHTDFKSGFAALKKIGYDKYMALECGVPGDPGIELPKSAKYLKSCM